MAENFVGLTTEAEQKITNEHLNKMQSGVVYLAEGAKKDIDKYQKEKDSELVEFQDEFQEHKEPLYEGEAHGLRVNNGQLQYQLSDGNYVTVETAKSPEHKTYGVVIDIENSNPDTRVKYIEDAVGMKEVTGNNGKTDWGDWKETWVYKKFKPCILKDGKVQYYLDKEDFTKKLDGTPSNLNGSDGDVMIEIDKIYSSISTKSDGIHVKISDSYRSGLKPHGFEVKNGDVRDKIYVGAYLGYNQSNKLRSISGVEPTGSRTIGSFRTLAEANGEGYHQVPWLALQLLQSVMVILLKSTDTQTALGRGYVDGNDEYEVTGNTNNKGMMYGETTGKLQMCFMGIEDFWGNKRWWIDGLKYDDDGTIKMATTDFNNDADRYKIVGKYDGETSSGYIKEMMGTEFIGFVPKLFAGSSSTYYCDYGTVGPGRFPYFGGDRSYGSYAGGFYLSSYSGSSAGGTLGARLFKYGK